METARGAGVLCTLGATLTALVSLGTANAQPFSAALFAVPQKPRAVESVGSSSAASNSSTNLEIPGITTASGIKLKDDSSVSGISSGAALGISSGAAQGISSGAALGISSGAALGISSGAALGISSGAALGISSGAALGISSGAALGISSGAALGISSGAALGISSGAALGISSGAALGISSGAALGISSGAALGISSGAALGISSGAVLGISSGAVLGISSGAALATGIGFPEVTEIPIVLAGPVESVDLVNGVFTSMGQTVVASTTMLRGLNEGDYVSVNGSVMGAGWLYADTVAISDERYVPGASPVVVTGMMSEVNEDLGSALIGGLTVDFTSATSSGVLPRGNLFVFSGIQPVQEGVLLSTGVVAAE